MSIRKSTYEWYAIYTKTNWEKKICVSLREQKIECYLPLIKSLRKWSDRKKWIEEPLFRCYIFVRVSNVEFFDVLKTYGIFRYVSFAGKAYPIPEKQIESIKTLVSQTENEIILTYKKIEKGAMAEVLFGPLKGVQGEIFEICGQYRIVIRIESLGCSLYVNIDKDNLKLLKSEDIQVNKDQNRQKRKLISASGNQLKEESYCNC